MKILLAVFLCLTFTFSSFTQSKNLETLKQETKTFKKHKYYGVIYDKFEDKTRISFGGAVIKSSLGFAFGASPIISFATHSVFPGQVLKQTQDTFLIEFGAYSTGGWSFLKDRSLFVLADGERFSIPEGIRDSNISRGLFGDVKTDERLYFTVTREDLGKLANAKSLEIKLSNIPIKIKPEHQQIFLDILAITRI